MQFEIIKIYLGIISAIDFELHPFRARTGLGFNVNHNIFNKDASII